MSEWPRVSLKFNFLVTLKEEEEEEEEEEEGDRMLNICLLSAMYRYA